MLADCLKKILKHKVLVSRTNDGKMILRENKVMEVEVAKTPSGVTVKDGDCQKRCDYLLIYEIKDKYVAIFVELKKTLYEDNQEAMEQLRRSPPILAYLHSVCRIHCSAESEKLVMTTRYFLIGEKINQRFDKQPVTPGRPLPSTEYKKIKVNMFVGPRIGFDLLRSE